MSLCRFSSIFIAIHLVRLSIHTIWRTGRRNLRIRTNNTSRLCSKSPLAHIMITGPLQSAHRAMLPLLHTEEVAHAMFMEASSTLNVLAALALFSVRCNSIQFVRTYTHHSDNILTSSTFLNPMRSMALTSLIIIGQHQPGPQLHQSPRC